MQTSTPTPEYVSVTDVAQRLNVSATAVRAMIDRGELDALKVGRILRVSTASVDAFIAAATARQSA